MHSNTITLQARREGPDSNTVQYSFNGINDKYAYLSTASVKARKSNQLGSLEDSIDNTYCKQPSGNALFTQSQIKSSHNGRDQDHLEVATTHEYTSLGA